MAATDARTLVKVEPPEVKFAAPVGSFSYSHHKLSLVGKDKLALKIKCSDNRVYRLRPVYSFLEAGKEVTLTVGRTAAPDKKDKLVVHVAKVPASAAADPAAFWKARHGQPPDAQLTLVLSLTPATDPVPAPAKDADKDPKDAKDAKDPKDAKDAKDPKEAKNPKEAKEAKDPEEAKDPKDAKYTKEATDTKDSKEAKDTKETKKTKPE